MTKLIPECGMWCIQGTITFKSGEFTTSPQFATFYLHPEVNAWTKSGAEQLARELLNPTKDPNITPNVSAHLVSVGALNDWTDEELKKMDPDVFKPL